MPARLRPLASALALAALAAAPAAASDPPRFDLPVACEIGRECTIQNYVDQDPGPAARDYTCGRLTYDGHDGTDIRVPNYMAMERGVPVLAAAPGVVFRVRDGVRDVSVLEIGQAAVAKWEAGNAVVIDHAGGWRTLYAHLRKGSVAVKPGQQVAAGQQVGLIGISGRAAFPHVHFEVLRAGRSFDPFTGREPGSGCGDAGRPLWSEAALRQLAYQPTGLLNAGFAPTRPEAEEARHGRYAAETLPAESPALWFWVEVFGLQDGDRETMRLLGPDGAELAGREGVIAGWAALAFRRLSDEGSAGGWPPGRYRGEYRLVRMVDGAPRTIVEAVREIELR